MDHRIPLKFHTVLAFAGMPCHIETVTGQGSNAIVYKGWYPDALDPELRHHVLIKELFPFHPQGKIRREEDGTISVAREASDLWQDHKESFEAGNRIHLRLLADHPGMMAMGANLNSFSCNGTLYSVLGYTGGRSLREELNREEADLRCVTMRMIRLLDALEVFHKSGYLHLDISPDNIMLVGQEEKEHIFLIDYNGDRRPEQQVFKPQGGLFPSGGDHRRHGYSGVWLRPVFRGGGVFPLPDGKKPDSGRNTAAQSPGRPG